MQNLQPISIWPSCLTEGSSQMVVSYRRANSNHRARSLVGLLKVYVRGPSEFLILDSSNGFAKSSNTPRVLDFWDPSDQTVN